MTYSQEQLHEIVRRKYADIARDSKSCCGSEHASAIEDSLVGDAYSGVEGYVPDADLGLGCGLPVEHAGLKPGDTVLDLGSGAGLDAFVARSQVGDAGQVIGVDMTAEMIARSRRNLEQLGFDNVDFRLGEIEHMPVASDSVDVVISNCVLNLVPDKAQAFAEIHRVLKPGGHFCISDVVASQQLPNWVSDIAEAYAGCVSGAIPKPAYLGIIENTGFREIHVVTERRIEVPEELLTEHLSAGQIASAREQDLHVMSITVTARKQ